MARVDLKLLATKGSPIRAGKVNPDGLLELECGSPVVVRFTSSISPEESNAIVVELLES